MNYCCHTVFWFIVLICCVMFVWLSLVEVQFFLKVIKFFGQQEWGKVKSCSSLVFILQFTVTSPHKADEVLHQDTLQLHLYQCWQLKSLEIISPVFCHMIWLLWKIPVVVETNQGSVSQNYDLEGVIQCDGGNKMSMCTCSSQVLVFLAV